MLALITASKEGRLPAEIAVVLSPKEETPAVQVAREQGVPVALVPPGDDYGPRMLQGLAGCRWVCLAGYLRLLPIEVLQAFPNRILNIHPALLPKFGGKGMYGHHVHEAVVAAKETESGCTVHLVNERYDEGQIVLQKRCPVFPDDTAEDVATRVLKLEHQAYAEALAQMIQSNRQ